MTIHRSTLAPTRRVLLAGAGAALAAAGLPSLPLLAATDGKINVAFIGDSMIDGVWGGVLRLAAADKCLSQHYKFGRFGENGTGLTRPGKYDWILVTKGIIAEFKPALIVISIGLNDRQNIVDLDGARYALGTDAYRHRYAQLVTELAQVGKEAPAGLLWLGMPVLREKVAQADVEEKNSLDAKAVGGIGDAKLRFAEPWRAAGDGSFQPYGLGPDGSSVQLRATDGIHFTATGYDVVARYLMPKLIAQLASAGIASPCEVVR